MWSLRNVQMPQTITDKHSLLPTITSQTVVNHDTISGIHSTYFIYQHKPAGGYLSKASAVDTHYEQQLISSWKTRNGDKVTKTLVDTMDWPLSSQNIGSNLENASFKVAMKKKTSSQQVVWGCMARPCHYTWKLDWRWLQTVEMVRWDQSGLYWVR